PEPIVGSVPGRKLRRNRQRSEPPCRQHRLRRQWSRADRSHPYSPPRENMPAGICILPCSEKCLGPESRAARERPPLQVTESRAARRYDRTVHGRPYKSIPLLQVLRYLQATNIRLAIETVLRIWTLKSRFRRARVRTGLEG